MPLPPNVGTGTVTGNFMDSAGVSMAGKIKFVPTAKKLLNATASPPVTILPKAVEVTLSDGGFTQVLVATDDPDNNPVGWNYRVEFQLTAAAVDPFNIEVPEGGTVDLTIVAPVGSANGQMIIRGAGLPEGGTVGQVLAKASETDLDTEWIDPPEGGGGGGFTAYSQVQALTGYPSSFPPAAHSHPSTGIADSTSVGRALVTAADAAAARSAIGAGTSSLALGTTGTTAKAGNYAPTKADVGLANVDNTSDANKPISTAQQTALDGKLTDASGQTTRWRGIYADEASLPTGVAGDFAITLA